MTNFWRIPLLVLLLAFFLPAGAQDSDLRTVLDHLVESYGGEENLHKMDSMVQQWNLMAVMRKSHGIDTRSVRIPGQLRAELQYPDKSETRILDGETAYVIFGNEPPQPVSGMQLGAMQLQLMRLYSPLTLRSKIDSLGMIEQDDLLALSLVENGVHAHYMVNKDNWRIEKVAGTITTPAGEIQFLAEYSDFRVVDGVLMHHHENKFAGGMNTSVLQLVNVTFDAPLNDSSFKP